MSLRKTELLSAHFSRSSYLFNLLPVSVSSSRLAPFVRATVQMGMNEADREDSKFLSAFEEGSITAAEFGHREHLRVAYVFLARHPFDDALGKMESGLQRLLAHLDAPPSKFHVTLTRAWLLALHHFMHRAGGTRSFADFLAAGGVTLLDPAIMQTHYSPQRLSSDDARARFLEPDRQKIPEQSV